MKLSFLSGRTDRLPAITYSPAKSVAHTVSVKTSVEWIYSVDLSCKLGAGGAHCLLQPWPNELNLLTCFPQCFTWSHLTFLCTVLFSWKQEFLAHQHVHQLQIYQAQMATVGMAGPDKHRPFSRTPSSPTDSTLPHPDMDQPSQHVYTTGRIPWRLPLTGRANAFVHVGSTDLNASNTSCSNVFSFSPIAPLFYDAILAPTQSVQLINHRVNIHTVINYYHWLALAIKKQVHFWCL